MPGKLRKPKFETSSQIPTNRIYGEEDAGKFPFTRGIYDQMYRTRLWTMRQYAGFGSAAESNLRYKYLLASGTTGLSVAFDLPTQIGYDSDHPMAEGEVGKVGVSIASVEDNELLDQADAMGQTARGHMAAYAIHNYLGTAFEVGSVMVILQGATSALPRTAQESDPVVEDPGMKVQGLGIEV